METWECFYKNDATAKAETLKKVEEAIARKLNNERKTDAGKNLPHDTRFYYQVIVNYIIVYYHLLSHLRDSGWK